MATKKKAKKKKQSKAKKAVKKVTATKKTAKRSSKKSAKKAAPKKAAAKKPAAKKKGAAKKVASKTAAPPAKPVRSTRTTDDVRAYPSPRRGVPSGQDAGELQDSRLLRARIQRASKNWSMKGMRLRPAWWKVSRKPETTKGKYTRTKFRKTTFPRNISTRMSRCRLFATAA